MKKIFKLLSLFVLLFLYKISVADSIPNGVEAVAPCIKLISIQNPENIPSFQHNNCYCPSYSCDRQFYIAVDNHPSNIYHLYTYFIKATGSNTYLASGLNVPLYINNVLNPLFGTASSGMHYLKTPIVIPPNVNEIIFCREGTQPNAPFTSFNDFVPFQCCTIPIINPPTAQNVSFTASTPSCAPTAVSFSTNYPMIPTNPSHFNPNTIEIQYTQGGQLVTIYNSEAANLPFNGNLGSFTYNQPGTYTATLNINTSCGSFTKDIQIVVPAGLPLTVSPSSSTICGNTPTTLTASPQNYSSYQWRKNGVIIAGATGSTLSVSTAGTYTVSATNAGCTATASATVISGTLPPVSLTYDPTTVVCADGAVKLTASPNNTNYSYTWSSNTDGGSESPTQNIAYGFFQGHYDPYQYNISTPQTFSVTVTDVLTGCTALASVSIMPPKRNLNQTTSIGNLCCFIESAKRIGEINGVMNVNASTNLSSVPANILAGPIIKVWGTLIVDNDWTVINKTILFGPNAKVVVNAGRRLEINNNSILKACTNYMWRGIELASPSSQIFTNGNSRIEEAKIAVNIAFNSDYLIGGSMFNDNFIGVKISNNLGLTTSPPAPNYNRGIGANIFKSGVNANQLKMPYETRTVGFAGIQLINSGGNSMANPNNFVYIGVANLPNAINTFDKLDFGIHATNSQLNVNYAAMTNISRNFSNHPYSGNGMYVEDNQHSSNAIRRLIVRNSTFGSSYQGILFDDMNVEITDNTMNDMVNGMRGVRAMNGLIGGAGFENTLVIDRNEINLNTTSNVSNGVINTNVATNTPQNPISSGQIGALQTCFFKYAILIQGCPRSVVSISSNIIRLPVFSPINYSLCSGNAPAEGIRVEHIATGLSANTFVGNNDIKNGYVGTRFVNVSSSNAAQILNIQENDHYFDQGGPSASGVGFVLDNSDRIGMFCNEVLGTGTIRRLGFQINGSPNFLLEANRINIARVGVQFNGNCVSTNAIRLNAFQSLNTAIELRNSATLGWQFGTMADHPSNLFIGNTLDMNVVNSSIPFFGFHQNAPFYTSSLSKLRQDNNGVISNFQPFNVNGVVKPSNSNLCNWTFSGFRMVAEETEQLMQTIAEGIEGQFKQPSEYQLQRELMEKLTENPDLLLTDPDLAQYFIAKENDNIGKFTELEQRVKELQAKIADLDEQYSTDELLKEQAIAAEIQAKMAYINSLTPQNQIEINEKTVNEIYVNTQAKGIQNFTEAQLVALYGVAQQCPFSGGDVVYKARTMIGLSGDQLVYDDQTNCALGFYKKEIEEEQIADPDGLKEIDVLSVFPNPATELVTIYHTIPEGTEVNIQVLNALGQKVGEKEVSWSDFSTFIDVSRYATGLYNLLFRVNGKVTETHKVVVRH